MMRGFRLWIAAIALVVCLVFSSTTLIFAGTVGPDEDGAYRPTIYINDEKYSLGGIIPPSGSTLVPFRALFDALKIEASFDNTTKTLTAVNDDLTLSLTAGQMYGFINDEKIALTQSPALTDEGVLYVNLRFIAEAYGAVVAFDKEALSIAIHFPGNS